jgi:hypothetical protein
MAKRARDFGILPKAKKGVSRLLKRGMTVLTLFSFLFLSPPDRILGHDTIFARSLAWLAASS